MLMDFRDLEADSKVSRHTWRLWVRQRKLAHVRLGRRVLVEEAAYRQFLAERRQESRPEGTGR
jgi:hypothetical protein